MKKKVNKLRLQIAGLRSNQAPVVAMIEYEEDKEVWSIRANTSKNERIEFSDKDKQIAEKMFTDEVEERFPYRDHLIVFIDYGKGILD